MTQLLFWLVGLLNAFDVCDQLHVETFGFLQSFHLQLMSPSGALLPPNNSGCVTQLIKIDNPQKV